MESRLSQICIERYKERVSDEGIKTKNKIADNGNPIRA